MRSTLLRGLAALTLVLAWDATAAGPPARRSFDTAADAADALIQAVAGHDTAQLAALFGPDSGALLSTGDAAQDNAQRDAFARLAATSHRLEPDGMDRNRMILAVGDDAWPFPVPIVRVQGRWAFDSSIGALMLRARHIGADELDAIEICSGYVAAQREYASQHASTGYATRLISSTGRQDGLYSDHQALVPRIFAEAALDGLGSKRPRAYHGYYFRVLTAQGTAAPGGAHSYVAHGLLLGGFAMVAWPVQYGVTGIHTFTVNQDGVVYQRDLGAQKDPLKAPVTTFNPEAGWRVVQ